MPRKLSFLNSLSGGCIVAGRKLWTSSVGPGFANYSPTRGPKMAAPQSRRSEDQAAGDDDTGGRGDP
jgi:hypothetical protein